MPKVSIIIPIYNTEKYLRKCLDSIVNQTLSDIEIICIDDGSTDNSLNILNEYASKDKRIKVLSQENSGAAIARNNAIKKALGEYIAFMDPDDYYPENNTLEKLYNNAKTNNVYICGGGITNYLQNEGSLKFSAWDANDLKNNPYNFYESKLIKYSDYQFPFAYTRFIYNRNFLIENNIFFPDYKRNQDPPFMVKAMILAKEFYALNETVYIYRVEHKSVNWTVERINDVLSGMEDLYKFSREYHFPKLNYYTTTRLKKYLKECFSSFKLSTFLLLFKLSLREPNLMKICGNEILQNVFSIRNISKYEKQLTLLGFKIKIKRGKNEKV